ncbi:MAG: hypothetical protein KF703_07860 [Actinobacteria bacterium]|nr:hypothetical protein [Actinomycetota bacterium]
MAARKRSVGRRAVPAPSAASALVLVLALSLVGAACSSDGSDGADAPRRTTTTVSDDADASTTTTAPRTTTSTTAAPTSTAAPDTTAGGSSAFRGAVDGQKDVVVTFTRGADALTDVRASGLELTCQPLAGGDAKTISVDVAMAQVPLGPGLLEHTEQGAPYEPTLSGSFTPAGAFAGSLYLSGQRDGYACGGEFTFLATPS